MIKIRYVVEVVDRDCFGGTKDFSKSFDSEEEAWEYYREQQKYARNYAEPYFDQVYYANKPYMVEEEVEEFDDSYVENEDDYYNEWDDYGTSGEKYGYYNGYSDDVIDDAFDGCPEATWNVD